MATKIATTIFFTFDFTKLFDRSIIVKINEVFAATPAN